jgi:DNA-binding IclR family transcriptional regulator
MKILTACAQHPDGCTRQQLTILTGYKRSTRDAYVQRLRVAGLVDDGEKVAPTQEGIDLLGPDFEPLPTGAALLTHWLRELPEGERACLQVAVEVYPEPTDREAISNATGYKRSTRDAYLQRLGTRRLVEDLGHGQIRAAHELFD